MLGGRWWYQRVDMTLNFYGAVTVTTPSVSASRSQVVANSGSIGWVDPFIGFRVVVLRDEPAPAWTARTFLVVKEGGQ